MSRHPNAKPDGFGAHITKNQKATIKESNYINFIIALKKIIKLLESFPIIKVNFALRIFESTGLSTKVET